MIQLRAYQLALSFYRAGKLLPLPSLLLDQWKRASISIVLNLAEGYGKKTRKDRERFFQMAFGSIRECQAIVDLEPEMIGAGITQQLDQLAASVYKLLNH